MFAVLSLLLAAGSLFAAQPDTLRGGPEIIAPPPEKAVCAVCFMRGEGSSPEKVKASTVFDGTPYYFCSHDCKKAFESDPTGFIPLILPSPAPVFSVRDLDGNLLDQNSFKNRILLLDFWATWCKPCIKTMPELAALQKRYEGKLVVLGISIDETPEAVRRYVTKHGSEYRVAMDAKESPAWQAYRVKAVPTACLIDSNGRWIRRWIGAPPAGAIGAVIDSLLALPAQGAK